MIVTPADSNGASGARLPSGAPLAQPEMQNTVAPETAGRTGAWLRTPRQRAPN